MFMTFSTGFLLGFIVGFVMSAYGSIGSEKRKTQAAKLDALKGKD